METTTQLNVGGMTCGGCVASVTRVLKQIQGVSDADVSLEAGRAVVRFDPDRTTVDALLSAVERAGFTASL
ncbi:MAG: hypothetical protein GC151_07645 [Betaproteobacteria bacterium]|nr:hypothetical protein [Betaproteobacteria bacterium]